MKQLKVPSPASGTDVGRKVAIGLRLMNTVESPYRLVSTEYEGMTRYLVLHKISLKPHVLLCMYSAAIATRLKPNSVYSYLSASLILVAWAETYELDLEEQLLEGRPFSSDAIEAFSKHLSKRRGRWGLLSDSYINTILLSAQLLSEHYQLQAPTVSGDDLRLREFRAKREKTVWEKVRREIPDTFDSKTLSPDELQLLEDYLHPETRAGRGVSFNVAVRDFVIWLHFRHFGLRGGELLSLRLSDMKMTSDCWLKVPKVNLDDSRGRYAPATKSGSRELPLLEDATELDVWTRRYLNEHRIPDAQGYLLTSLRGNSLSTSSLQKLGQKIQRDILPDFVWHRLRHTYAVEWLDTIVAASEDAEELRSLFDSLNERMGWNHPDSSAPYLDAAMRKLARISMQRLATQEKSEP